MRPLCAILLLLSSASNLLADEKKPDSSDYSKVTKFLKEHVLGKTLVSPRKMYKIDEGKIEVDHEDVTNYSSFSESAAGFSFDMTITKKYTRFDIGKDGKRILPGIDRNSTEVFRYEIAERFSTKKLMGMCRLITSTSP